MHGFPARAVRPLRTICLLVAALMLVSGSARGAQAARTHPLAIPADVVIGPLHLGHGFTVTLTAEGCGARGSALSVLFERGSRLAHLAHIYGGAGRCSVSRDGATGTLRAHWGRILSIDVTAHAKGPLTRLPLPGCHAITRYGKRAALLHGTVEVHIHPRVLGSLSIATAKGTLQPRASASCSSSPISLAGTTSLDDGFGPVSFFAFSSQHGSDPRARIVTASVIGRDRPAPGVTGITSAYLQGGPSLFSFAPGLGSARLTGFGPYLTGSLTFTAAPTCSGRRTEKMGLLRGDLTLRDPILGAVPLVTAANRTGTLETGDGGTACLPANPAF